MQSEPTRDGTPREDISPPRHAPMTAPGSRVPDAGARPVAPMERPASAIDLGGGAWIARGDVDWNFSRSSGPGGQNVNKVNSRAELRVRLDVLRGMHPAAVQRLRVQAGGRVNAAGEIIVVAEETRSQIDNREACLARLRELVGRALVIPKTRKKTKPTRGSKERRLEGKKREARRKSDRRVRDD